MIKVRRLFSTTRLLKQQNHYSNLNLTPDASQKDIKSSFKKLSLKLHPDILNSLSLTPDELSKKQDKYLKIKKSYEILIDPKKKSEYDYKMGHSKAGYKSQASQHHRSNVFHYSGATNRDQFTDHDVPHFDSKKHFERNMRNEKRMKYRRVMESDDIFGKALYFRDFKNGPKKDIYKVYNNTSNVRTEEESKKIVMKWVYGFVGLFFVWYITAGRYSTVKENVDDKEKKDEKKEIKPYPTALNVNNEYGKMLIKNSSQETDNENNEFKQTNSNKKVETNLNGNFKPSSDTCNSDNSDKLIEEEEESRQEQLLE